MNNNIQLIFVYNADASIFGVVTDFAHKILSPDTYSCNLCKLTYGAFAMGKKWKDFIAGLPYPIEFLHRDEFAKAYPALSQQPLPAVFKKMNGNGKILIKKEDIDRETDLEGLIRLINTKLSER